MNNINNKNILAYQVSKMNNKKNVNGTEKESITK